MLEPKNLETLRTEIIEAVERMELAQLEALLVAIAVLEAAPPKQAKEGDVR